MSVQPDVQITGKIGYIAAYEPQPDSSVPELGTIEVALCGYGPQIPRVGGEAVFGRVTSFDAPVSTTGAFSVFLYSNGLIDPLGTYYTVTIKDSNGDIVQVQAYAFQPGQFDLSTLEPFDPNIPPPPLPFPITNLLLIVPYSYDAEFPGDTYTSWQITLTGDCVPTFTNLVDGNLYTIIIVQDGNGEHIFNWPSNALNATPVNPDPNSMTVQTFVAVSGQLYPIGAGTYYP